MSALMPQQPKPYPWEGPPETFQLWKEVGNGIDKSHVTWQSAVESLDAAKMHLRSFKGARDFVEKYMASLIDILVQQKPSKIAPNQRNCVEESLALAVDIVSQDLEIQLARNGECKVLDVLALVFNKEKAYYHNRIRRIDGRDWNGLPEIRLQMIDRFHEKEKGFSLLSRYMLERSKTSVFPDLGILHHILAALRDLTPSELATVRSASMTEKEDAALDVMAPIMQFLNNCTEDTLAKLASSRRFDNIMQDLRRSFDQLVTSRRWETYGFYSFWRSITMKLITSESLELKLTGWRQIGNLCGASAIHRPSPREYEILGAGCNFVNGKYDFTGCTTPDGYQYARQISYERKIPLDEYARRRKITLFQCTMRSQQKWWFLSDADEEEPGTDRDIDYYKHMSQTEGELLEPPPSGWVKCSNVGVDPPPQLKAHGRLVPPGEEFNTLEHQLAQWAIENRIFELQLSNPDFICKKIFLNFEQLFNFLALMCEHDNGIESSGVKTPNMFCLQTSHLSLAWDVCRKASSTNALVRFCQLLADILPSCPSGLAISLLLEVRRSMYLFRENLQHYVRFRDVNQFCLALAGSGTHFRGGSAPALRLSHEVQSEVLTLLWKLLTHPRSSGLRSRDDLENLWSFLASSSAGLDQEFASVNGHGRGLTQEAVSKRKRTKRPSSVLESLPDDLLDRIFQYLGPGHYYFVAGVSKRCRQMYRNATSSVVGRNVIPKTTTMIARIAESVSRSQLYLFQETIITDHATDDGYVELTRCMRRKIGERAISVARAAMSSGNLMVLNYALKQPEGISFMCNEFSICKDAAKNGDVPMLELALSLGCPCNKLTCGLAAEYGQFEALQILRGNECPWDESVCSFAAGNGDLAMLQYARENNCPWNRSTLVNARANGHWELAQWASENGCPDM